MRKSTSVTVTLLAGLVLTSCCISMSGCGRSPSPDRTWYDASGNRIQEKWKTDAGGNKLLDEQGRPIPDPHVPYDSHHRPWVYENGAWVPLPVPVSTRSSSSSRRSWFWGGSGSGYRSFSSGGSSSSPSHSSTPSSISRGGFGSTGSGSVSS
jgi:hypothetical protein